MKDVLLVLAFAISVTAVPQPVVQNWPITGLRNTAVPAGAAIRLTCNYTGPGQLVWREYVTTDAGSVLAADDVIDTTHAWYGQFSLDTRHTLVIASAASWHAGRYGCQAIAVGLDAFAEVIIVTEPAICGFQAFEDNILIDGRKDEFQCGLSYVGKWGPTLDLVNRNTSLNPNNIDLNETVSYSSVISISSGYDGSTFTCVVRFHPPPLDVVPNDPRYDRLPPEYSGECGVNVKIIPDIGDNALLGPTNVALRVGDTATLQCAFTGDNGTITWAENVTSTERVLSIDGKPEPDHPFNGTYYHIWKYDLVLAEVTTQHAGLYTCSVPELNLTSSAQVIVLDDPQCEMMNSMPDRLIENRTDSLLCSINYYGDWAPVLQWSFEGNDTDGSAHVDGGSSSLVANITGGVEFHKKKFICNVRFQTPDNHNFPPQQDMSIPNYASNCDVFIEILYDTRDTTIYLPNDGQYLIPGDKVVCHANGNPTPQYSWHRTRGNGPHNVKGDTLEIGADMGDIVGYSCVAVNIIDGISYAQTEYFLVEPGSHKDDNTAAIVGGTLGAVAFVLLLAVLFVFYKKRRQTERKDPAIVLVPVPTIPPVPPHDKWRLSPDKIDLVRRKENVLGSGHFGIVYRARVYGLADGGGDTPVALKTLKDDPSERDEQDLKKELKILKELPPHENVIRFIGWSYLNSRLCILMELANQGNLRTLLLTSRSDTIYGNLQEGTTIHVDTLIGYAIDVAKGMGHIAEHGYIHRDLAIRNILMADNVCKISDFGLARDNLYSSNGPAPLPMRWMSPEALDNETFTTEGDVWAYGILLWEIVTGGALPYPGVSRRSFRARLRSGQTMKKPVQCSEAIYDIMKKCWNMDPKRRPKFPEIVKMLERLMDDTEPAIYLDLISSSQPTTDDFDDDRDDFDSDPD